MNRVAKFALVVPLFLCPVMAIAQVPSDADLDAIKSFRGTMVLPSDRDVRKANAGIEMPDQAAIDARMQQLRQATEQALKDPSLKRPRSQVPTAPLQMADEAQRQEYRAQIESSKRRALQKKQADGSSLESVVARYQKEQERALRKAGADVPDIPEDAILVFVSFSMPDHVLETLSRQAREIGATLILRGLKNGSLKETQLAARDVNPAGAAWQVNPGLFTSFKVKSVPTFVVTGNKDVLDHGCPLEASDKCSIEGSYAVVSGDLSIELALRTIARRTEISYVRDLALKRLALLEAKRK